VYILDIIIAKYSRIVSGASLVNITIIV